ncbi:MAG: ABC transporter ATP-binding protein [Desulfovibrionales bacterium]
MMNQHAQDTTGTNMVDMDAVELTLESRAGRVNILKGLNLRVGKGETLSVVGPSGAGKTSMLMVMSGLERPTSGRVRVAGRDLKGLDEDGLAAFRQQHVGIVFQSFHLVPSMTALENVALPLELAGDTDAVNRGAEALEMVGLGERATHYPFELSGGEQQRVAIARAFVARPSLLLADEPTGNLDRTTEALVMDLLFTLQEQHGITFVLVTHDPRLASRCSRTVHLEDGRIFERESGS